MRIKNYDEIITYSSSVRKKTRELALNLFDSAIEAADPYQIIHNNVKIDLTKKELNVEGMHFPLSERKIWIIGAGKAVGKMAEALEEILTGQDYQGTICVPEGIKSDLRLKKIHCYESTHPLPSEVNLLNTKVVLELIEKIQPNDLVIALISGGGSAIWAAPIPPITVNDLITLNKTLINSGMNIHEINVVRKHVSSIKGGKLVKQIPAEILVFLISDVIGDNLESIASGYFHPDSSSFYETKLLLNKYRLWVTAVPDSVKMVIDKGIEGLIPETPKEQDEVFNRVQAHILASNKLACKAIVENAKKLGLKALILTDKLEGDARCLGRLLARIYSGLAEQIQDAFVVVSGGEPTVEVYGNGIGGRNQEVVGAVLNEFLSYPHPIETTFLSAGTDGIDGNSPYAGALIDDISVNIACKKELDLTKFQKENNMSKFFEELGGSVLLSGPTGTNVMDLQIAIINTSNFSKKK
ncbi:MAG: glycerate kinase [Promethearchaeota archaeon]